MTSRPARSVPDGALDGVVAYLRCPVCDAAFIRRSGALVCADGHAFDVARQGYVNLATGARGPGTADSAAMVAARDSFLGAGHYRPIAEAVAAAVAPVASVTTAVPGIVVDVAGGTGYYLAAVLEAAPERRGVCLDLSASALRRAARVHPRAAAIGADAWGRLPLRDGCAAVVSSIFGPRNADEVGRLLAPGGVFVVVSPRQEHLRELVEPLALIRVDPDKAQRESAAFARFARVAADDVTYRISLGHDDVLAAVGMGPSAKHGDATAQVLELPDPLTVTVAVRVTTYAGRPTSGREPD